MKLLAEPVATMHGRSVLVIGNEGFIGKHLVRQLEVAGARVVGGDLNGASREADTKGCMTRSVDVRDASSVSHIVHATRPDWVVHLAAMHMIPECEARPADCMSLNILGTQNVAAAAAEIGAKMVFFSSADVYRQTSDPLHEDSPRGPTTVYGMSKVCGEEVVARMMPEQSMTVRPFNVYGPGDGNPHLIPALISRAIATAPDQPIPVGNLDSARDYIYVESLAAQVVQLMAGEYRGTLNLGTGIARTGHDVLKDIATAVGRHIAGTESRNLMRAEDRAVLRADMTAARELGLRIEVDEESWHTYLARTVEWVRTSRAHMALDAPVQAASIEAGR